MSRSLLLGEGYGASSTTLQNVCGRKEANIWAHQAPRENPINDTLAAQPNDINVSVTSKISFWGVDFHGFFAVFV